MAKILIAEDEPDIRELIVFTLQFGGHEVIATSSGAEAVERATTEQPDLILLDVRMPRMTGYEACEALKKDSRTEKIPVVFLSAKGQEKEVENGLKVGAVAYILKPFAPDQLIKQVKELLDEHGAKPSEKVAPAASPAKVEPPPSPAPAVEKAEAASAPSAPEKKVEAAAPAPEKKAQAVVPASPKKEEAVSPSSEDATPKEESKGEDKPSAPSGEKKEA